MAKARKRIPPIPTIKDTVGRIRRCERALDSFHVLIKELITGAEKASKSLYDLLWDAHFSLSEARHVMRGQSPTQGLADYSRVDQLRKPLKRWPILRAAVLIKDVDLAVFSLTERLEKDIGRAERIACEADDLDEVTPRVYRAVEFIHRADKAHQLLDNACVDIARIGIDDWLTQLDSRVVAGAVKAMGRDFGFDPQLNFDEDTNLHELLFKVIPSLSPKRVSWAVAAECVRVIMVCCVNLA